MKIVYLNDDFPPHSSGGAAVIVDRLSQAFADLGHQVSIITTTRDQPKTTKSKKRTIHWLHSDYNLRWQAYLSLHNPQTLPHLKTLFDSLKPDVIHAHNLHTHLSYHSLKLARDTGAKVIFTGHDTMPFFYGRLTNFIDSDHDGIPDTLDLQANSVKQLIKNKLHYNPLRNPVIRHYLTKHVGTVAVVSPLLASLYHQNGVSKTTTIPNGFDPADWAASSKQVRSFQEKHRIPSKSLFFAGRIRKDKGSFSLLQALCKLPQDLQLVVAGPNDWGITQITHQTDHLGLNHRLSYLGELNQRQLALAFHSATMTVVPSLCLDTFSNIAAEALVCKRPLIVSQFAGISHLLTDREHCLIINPFQQEELVSSIDQFLSKPKLAQRMAQKGYKFATTKLSHQRFVTSYFKLYSS